MISTKAMEHELHTDAKKITKSLRLIGDKFIEFAEQLDEYIEDTKKGYPVNSLAEKYKTDMQTENSQVAEEVSK